MQCSHCGKSDWVTIGDQKYCANCGEPATASQSDQAAPKPPASGTITDLKLAVPPSPPSTAPVTHVPTGAVMPTAPAPQNLPKLAPAMTDISRAQPAATYGSKPANSFHQGPASTSAGVLDLRQSSAQTNPTATPTAVVEEPKPALVKPSQPTAPAPAPKVTVTPPVPKPAAPIAAVPTPPPASQIKAPIASIDTAPVAKLAVTEPTPVKTPAPAAQATTSESETATQPLLAPPAPAIPTTSPIQKFVRPTTTPAPSSPPPAPATDMPNHLATQLSAMQKLVPPAAEPATSRSDAFKLALSSAPSTKSVVAATLAIAIMGGYIWLNNYNTLSVKTAGQKAGIQASLPGFVPSSYNLSGPVAYGPGFVTMQFKSPASSNPLSITQRRTDWSSSSLLELFVNSKSSSYVSVQNQGLTIYLYNGNQATWVNKGIQYVIEGNTLLNRDQILKIAESL